MSPGLKAAVPRTPKRRSAAGRRLLLAGAGVAVAGLAGCSSESLETRFGAYRLDGALIVSVRESLPGTYRLRVYQTGVTRRFEPEGEAWRSQDAGIPDNLGGAELRFTDDGFELRKDGRVSRAEKLPGRVVRGRVRSGRIDLNAVLNLPPGPGPHPGVVLAQGSGDDAATRTYGSVDFFVANGIAAIAYDKRGTGDSGGAYVHDFDVLADDLVAVLDWAASQAEIDADRIGITGYSQGGWVGPLAASKSAHARFVIVNYGLLSSPEEEEVIETVARARKNGVPERYLDDVAELSRATVEVMASDFENWDGYNRVLERLDDPPWLGSMEGTTIGAFESWPQWIVSIAGPYKAPKDLDWYYTSHAVLDRLAERRVPVVWSIAEYDTSAPNESTLEEVRRRLAAGEPTHLYVVPDSDHGFVTRWVGADGKVRHGNYHPDAFRLEVGWVRYLTGLDDEPPPPPGPFSPPD